MANLNSTVTPLLNEQFTTENITEVSSVRPEYYADRDLSYLLLPLSSLIIIAFLTITVIILLKRKRRIDRLRHHLMPYYNFAPGEEDDWETELLESEGDVSARKVIQPEIKRITTQFLFQKSSLLNRNEQTGN